MDILVLFLILEEMVSVFHHWEWLLLVYHIWRLLRWGSFPLCPLSGVFIINWCWILSKTFSASTEMIIWFLFFNLLISITLIDLWILKNPCNPGINPTWSWCVILLMCCWIQFASIFLCVCVHQRYWPVIFFFCDIFVWFWFQGDGGLVEWAWECSFLCSFLEEFQKGRC